MLFEGFHVFMVHLLFKDNKSMFRFSCFDGEGDGARFVEFVRFYFNFQCLKDFLLIDIDL